MLEDTKKLSKIAILEEIEDLKKLKQFEVNWITKLFLKNNVSLKIRFHVTR